MGRREESPDGSAWRTVVRTVIGGVLVAVLGAAALGGGSWLIDWFDERSKPDIPTEAYGSWTFDHFDSAPPLDPISGFTFQFHSLLLRDDGTYTATGQIVTAGGPDMAISRSGTFEMVDDDSVRMQPDDAEGPQSMSVDIAVAGNELRLVDPAQGVTYVFLRNV